MDDSLNWVSRQLAWYTPRKQAASHTARIRDLGILVWSWLTAAVTQFQRLNAEQPSPTDSDSACHPSLLNRLSLRHPSIILKAHPPHTYSRWYVFRIRRIDDDNQQHQFQYQWQQQQQQLRSAAHISAFDSLSRGSLAASQSPHRGSSKPDPYIYTWWKAGAYRHRNLGRADRMT